MTTLFKKLFLLVFLFGSLSLASAQNHYTQVYIPTVFPSISDGINPYQISSSLQKVLMDKGIKATFNKSTDAENYCQELTVVLDKRSNLFRSKVHVQLVDCMGSVVWENTGEGMSKGFVEGYAEAVADALKDLKELPQSKVKTKNTAQPVRTLPALVQNEKQIYFNDTYLVELKPKEKGAELLVLNSEKLGYDEKQVIATLQPADLEGLYEVSFIKPNGEVWSGMVMLKTNELSLSIAKGEEKEKIVLYKQ